MKTRILTLLVAIGGMVTLQANESLAQQGYLSPSQQAQLGYLLSQQQTAATQAGYTMMPYGSDELVAAGYELAADEEMSGAACLSDCACDDCGGCGESCCCDTCCGPCWQFFGEFLYMRARNAEVVYGVPFNGPVTSPPDVPIQVGRTGIVDPDYAPAFRVGFSGAVSECASIGVTYSYFAMDTFDAISTESPYVIRSMVAHPSTLSASSDGLQANASLGIDYDLVDLDFRRLLACGDYYSVNWLAGARYGNLNQTFRSQFAINGQESVLTDINFEGGGIRLGLEGERHARCSGWMVYGKAAASFVAGEVRGLYAQGQAFDASVVDTSWKAGRIVSILDLELGVGWTSPGGCFRMTAGYFVSGWNNTVKTDEFIDAVKTNNFVGLGDLLTFDGLTVRAEMRY